MNTRLWKSLAVVLLPALMITSCIRPIRLAKENALSLAEPLLSAPSEADTVRTTRTKASTAARTTKPPKTTTTTGKPLLTEEIRQQITDRCLAKYADRLARLEDAYLSDKNRMREERRKYIRQNEEDQLALARKHIGALDSPAFLSKLAELNEQCRAACLEVDARMALAEEAYEKDCQAIQRLIDADKQKAFSQYAEKGLP